jgi:hypothetical protein
MTAEFEMVWMTTEAMGVPHAQAMAHANPGLITHVHAAPNAASEKERIQAWRNCDRNLLDWWRQHGSEEVQTDRVLVLEWDVFTNVNLLDGWVPPARWKGIVCPAIKSPVLDPGWPVFAEIDRLPRELRAWAIGAVPFAAMMVSREVLDQIALPIWDEVFASDIFCELRMPTIARAMGHPVQSFRPWSDVQVPGRQMPAGFQGMWHPEKRRLA